MKNIFAHIAGVNSESKELIKKSFSKKIFEIIDLDIITEKIINDKNMLYLYNRDEFYKNKLKDQNLSKLNIKQINNVIKKIDQKMNLYWKVNFDNAINNLISKIDKLVIVIGYNTIGKGSNTVQLGNTSITSTYLQGEVNINPVSGQISRAIINSDNNVGALLSFRTANLPRWAIRKDGNETGSNVGGDLSVRRYDDAGAFIDTPISIKRSTGAVTLNSAYALPTTAPTSGQVLGYLGAGTTQWTTPSSSGGVCGIANSSGVYTYYATLNLAITAAVSGQTVDILTDITETGSVTVTTKTGVKINGNGYTYTLSVNDATHAITTGSTLIEMFNIKVVRTGRANNSTGVVISKTSTVSLCTLKCQNVVFENTYGVAVAMNFSAIYGLTVNSYGTGIDTGNSAGNIYNCIVTSSAGIGIYNNDTSEIANCDITAATLGILSNYASVYNTRAVGSSSYGIAAGRIVNSTGVSTSGVGIYCYAGYISYNCVGISTSGVGLSGTFTNSTGISTSGYAGSGGTKTNCTLISSSNYGSFQENLNNTFLQSTTNVPLWLSTGKLVNSCTAICLWDNVGGHAVNTSAAATGVDIRNCNLTVTNASAYCINGASGSTFKYAVNTYKGSTTAVNTTNVTQGITNTSDNQGNILV